MRSCEAVRAPEQSRPAGELSASSIARDVPLCMCQYCCRSSGNRDKQRVFQKIPLVEHQTPDCEEVVSRTMYCTTPMDCYAIATRRHTAGSMSRGQSGGEEVKEDFCFNDGLQYRGSIEVLKKAAEQHGPLSVR